MNQIVGYYCPCDMWDGDVKNKTLYLKVPDSDSNYGVKDDLNCQSFYMPKEIVETWQPAYDYFQKGDFVVFEYDKAHFNNRTQLWDREFVLKIDDIEGTSLIFNTEQLLAHPYYIKLSLDSGYRCNTCANKKNCFRFATPLEITNKNKLYFTEGTKLYCTNSISNSPMVKGTFLSNKVYKCFDSNHIIDEYNNLVFISNEIAFFNFRTLSELELLGGCERFFFGDVEFVCWKNAKYASTTYGIISLEEIQNAIKYIQTPPKFCGHQLSLHIITKDANKPDYFVRLYELENSINHMQLSLGFGCQMGKLSELLAIECYLNT